MELRSLISIDRGSRISVGTTDRFCVFYRQKTVAPKTHPTCSIPGESFSSSGQPQRSLFRRRLEYAALVLLKRDVNVNIECNPIIEVFCHFFVTCDLKRYEVT